MTPTIAFMAKLVPAPEMYHWFDLGDVSNNREGHMPDDEMLMLPYDRCAVVGTQSNGSTFTLALSKSATSVSITGFVVHGFTRTELMPFAFVKVETGLQIMPPDGGELPHKDAYTTALRIVEDFLLSLRTGCSSYIPKARQSLINSKRAAKGKGPALFDWRTVIVKPAQPKGASQGGTHASPRLHDRRGHWRKYPSGKVGWVKSCKVGDPTRGVVFKDYEV